MDTDNSPPLWWVLHQRLGHEEDLAAPLQEWIDTHVAEEARQREAAHYFAKLSTTCSHNSHSVFAITQALKSHKEWKTLVDTNGRTPLMYALNSHAKIHQMFDTKSTAALRGAVDNEGRGTLFYALTSRHIGSLLPWLGAHKEDWLSTVPASGILSQLTHHNKPLASLRRDGLKYFDRLLKKTTVDHWLGNTFDQTALQALVSDSWLPKIPSSAYALSTATTPTYMAAIGRTYHQDINDPQWLGALALFVAWEEHTTGHSICVAVDHNDPSSSSQKLLDVLLDKGACWPASDMPNNTAWMDRLGGELYAKVTSQFLANALTEQVYSPTDTLRLKRKI